MEPMTPGYAHAWPTIAERLRRLAEWRPGPQPLARSRPDPLRDAARRAAAYTSLLDEAHKRVEEAGTDHEGKVSLRADVERAAAFFEDYAPKAGRGVAFFACSAGDLFEDLTLPRATRTHVDVDDAPYVAPLLQAADRRDWLIALVDTRRARLHGNTTTSRTSPSR